MLSPDDSPRPTPKTGCEFSYFGLLPAHSNFLRSLPDWRQRKFIAMLLQKAVNVFEVNSGWQVLGVAVHDDTALVRFEFFATRFTLPERNPSRPRQKAVSRRLTDRRGIGKLGIAPCAFFRYRNDDHEEMCDAQLQRYALRNLKVFERRYNRASPTDLQVLSCIDDTIREVFAAEPGWREITEHTYAVHKKIMAHQAAGDLLRWEFSGPDDFAAELRCYHQNGKAALVELRTVKARQKKTKQRRRS